MQLKNRELAVKMEGDDVRLLQKELKLLGFVIGDDELTMSLFGSTTEEAVKQFQKAHDIEPKGTVDEKTAMQINCDVEGTQTSGGRPFVVKGRVVYADGRPLTDGLVLADDRDLRSSERLGESATNNAGRFEIRYGPAQFARAEKRSADIVVHACNTKGRELVSSPIYFNAGPELTIDDLVVGGEVYLGSSEYQRLVEELTPLLQGLDFYELTEDETHRDISFLSAETGQNPRHIAFLIKAHRLMRKTNVAAEAYYGLFRQGLPVHLPALLAQSPEVQRRALVEAVRDNTIPAEFAEQIGAILAQLKELIVDQALESPAEPKKVTLSKLLGTVLPEREKLARFLSAHVKHSGPIADFWKELETDPELKNHVDDLRFSLQLGSLTRNHLPLVRELQQAKQSGKLSIGSRELTFEGFESLVKLDVPDWLDLFQREGQDGVIGIPSEVPGKDESSKHRNYAIAMTHMVEDAYPMAFLAHRLEADNELPGQSDLVQFFRQNPDFNLRSTRLDRFAEENPGVFLEVEDVEGTRTRIKAMQRLYRLAPRYTQTSGLLKLGMGSALGIARMGRNRFANLCADILGGRRQAWKVFEKANQVQATAINLIVDYAPVAPQVGINVLANERIPEVEGIPEWSTLFGSIELCGCEHCRSVYSPAAYFVDILHFLKDRESRISNRTVKEILFTRRPDLGEIELTCENTNTPLPYVDLVNEVLENAVAPPSIFGPFDLDESSESDLDSQNTRALRSNFNPELSDNAVITVGGRGRPWAMGEPWWIIDEPAFTYTIRKEQGGVPRVVARSRQTKGAAAELAANPQYLNEDAYKILSEAVYPWSLPFNLWDEEARIYLAHLGVPRHQLMETFLAGERQEILSRFDVACAYLGLTMPEARIITGEASTQPEADDPGVWNLWGFETRELDVSHSIPDPSDSTERISDRNWLVVLRGRVDVFLQQSGLSYGELLELLDTYYVNRIDDEIRTIRIVSTNPDNPATCETSMLELEGLDRGAAIRAMRFVRLWRKLGCSMRDLDCAITAFVPEDLRQDFLSEDFLIRLSHVQRLHDELGQPLVRLFAFWSIIDSGAYIDHKASGAVQAPSLYAQLFRNKAVINPLDPRFTEPPRAEPPLGLSGTLTDGSASIAAALSISAEDFDLLLGDGNVIPRDPNDPEGTAPHDDLSLDYLSRLFRHAVLAKALKLSVRDLLKARELMGVDPFASTLDTVLFVEKVGKVRESGFTFTQLDYLLRHMVAPSSGIAPAEEAIAVILSGIRSGLQAIAAENLFSSDPTDPGGRTTDPNGDLTRQKLALLNWDSEIIEQTVAILNDRTSFEAPLPTLTAEIGFPASYDLLLIPAASAAELPGAGESRVIVALINNDQVANELHIRIFAADGNQFDWEENELTSGEELEALRQRLIDLPDYTSVSHTEELEIIESATLIAGYTHPESIRDAIAYDSTDSTAGVLRFSRAMTVEERDLLYGLPGADPSFVDAVDILFEAPRSFIARHLRRFSVPRFSEDLAELPADEEDPTKSIEFPKSLADKLYFDVAAGTLNFIGVMTAQERDDLLTVSSEVNYQAAVIELFEQPNTEVPEADDTFITYTDDPTVLDDIDALFDEPTTPEDRFLHLLQKLLPHLKDMLSTRLVAQQLAEALNLETRVAEAFATRWVNSPADPTRRALDEFLDPSFAETNPNIEPTPLGFPSLFRTYIRLHKIGTLAATFGLTAPQLAWLFEYGPHPDVNWLDLNSLPAEPEEASASFENWLRLVDLRVLRDGLPMGEQTLGEIFLRSRWVDVSRADLVQYLVERIQWSAVDLEFLMGSNGFNLDPTGGAFRDERDLLRLHRCFTLLKRLGMSAAHCRALARDEVDSESARYAKQAVRAKYEEEQWLELAKPLRDALREKQRAALVVYLITHFTLPGGRSVRDTNDLYSHFLIDVEMDPCMLTSRIKQAISSTQLFVQRCLMNIEPDVAANAAIDERWRDWEKWMKNYRVWEANRKVFLYPENWIEPELRDDKSPFYRDLESELLQSDLTLETAQNAFSHYLEKLDEVARLEIVGLYHQVEKTDKGQIAIDILHVFGRTYGEPRVYYYRQRVDSHVDSDYWTAWEQVDLDIEGDHLLPVVWNRRLYLFWPLFAEKSYDYEVRMPATGASFIQPKKYWEIKLAWSEHKANGWTTKKVSSESLEFDVNFHPDFVPLPINLEQKSIFVWASRIDAENNLVIATTLSELFNQNLSQAEIDASLPINAFYFIGSNSEPQARWFDLMPVPITGAACYFMFIKEESLGDDQLYLPAPSDLSATGDTPALARTPPDRFMLLPHHDGSSIAEHPFFYLDDTRTFFVFPTLEEVREQYVPGYAAAPEPKEEFNLIENYYEELTEPVLEPVVALVEDTDDPTLYESSSPVRPVLAEATAVAVSNVLHESPAIGASEGGVATMSGIATRAGGEAISLMSMAGEMGVFGARWSAHTTGPERAMLTVSGAGAPVVSEIANILGEGPAAIYSAEPYVPTRYRFQTHYHPYVTAFVHALNRDGIEGLLQRQIQLWPKYFLPRRSHDDPPPPVLEFWKDYGPEDVAEPIVHRDYPKEDVDFEYDGAYSLYNWELFFHVPLMIADRLNKNQRFAEAQKWFHFIFDPTDTSRFEPPQKYWHTKPFHERERADYRREHIQYMLNLLAAAADPQESASFDEEEENDLRRLRKAIEQWRDDPFNPHLIARLRTTAYQKSVVMKYLDNLIAWGDQQFRRDTIESINEATQFYVMAAEILGRRPEDVPPRATPRTQTYNSLEPRLDELSNAMVQIEEFIPPSAEPSVVHTGEAPPLTLPMLYFCIPKNDKLLGYWDRVADRLFKTRHCMNIEGVVRQLPLFEPPIEPGLLVKAAAAGVDLDSVLNDINSGLPHYRFNVLLQKAAELCAEVKSLGSALLSALEKQDAEELALIRARHESSMLELVKDVKQKQYDEAVLNEDALRRSRPVAETRYLHYQKLLGAKEVKVPAKGEVVPDAQDSPHVSIEEEGGFKMIPQEKEEMGKLTDSHDDQETAGKRERLASIFNATGNISISPMGVGVSVGGSMVGSALSAFANYYRSESNKHTYQGTKAVKQAQYVMRAHDWALQSNLAAKDITQIDQQIAAAEVRKEIADQEKKNHEKQIENAEEIETFLQDKHTNQELYGWMIGQVSGVYFQSYQLAYDVAKRAEAAYRFELGLRDSSFIQFGYWDGLKKGLLAGEKLYHDLKRMEIAYLDQNKREYEITKHVSLMQIDPLALILLKETGECFVSLPEALFDFDCPGHYMRRIKSLGVSIPCVTGPYTSVNCTLTLLKSSLRHANTLLGPGYVRDLENQDPRFTDNFGSIQSVVTSGSQNDSGLFETNLRDERYLPFEGQGVISEWRLKLPANPSKSEPCQFDYETISDVVLHIRYTAREGGELLQKGAMENVATLIGEAEAMGSVRLFSLRHEFPTSWAGFKNAEIDDENPFYALTINLQDEHYPFWSKGNLDEVKWAEVYAETNEDVAISHNAGGTAPYFIDGSLGNLKTVQLSDLPESPIGEYTLYLSTNDIEDLWLVLAWGAE